MSAAELEVLLREAQRAAAATEARAVEWVRQLRQAEAQLKDLRPRLEHAARRAEAAEARLQQLEGLLRTSFHGQIGEAPPTHVRLAGKLARILSGFMAEVSDARKAHLADLAQATLMTDRIAAITLTMSVGSTGKKELGRDAYREARGLSALRLVPVVFFGRMGETSPRVHLGTAAMGGDAELLADNLPEPARFAVTDLRPLSSADYLVLLSEARAPGAL